MPTYTPAAPLTRTWALRAGRNLQEQLAEWGRLDGFQISWEVPFDYPVKFDAQFEGETFLDAVAPVFESMRSARHPIRFIAVTGNKVLRVVEW